MDLMTLSLGARKGEADPFKDPAGWLPDAPSLLKACDLAAQQPLSEALQGMLGEIGVPPLDLMITPLSARAAALGVRVGRAFYHHELRVRLPIPPALEPEVPVWSEADTGPRWREGILTSPKYFSFFQDAPLAAYYPNHRRKWRAHELLHGAQGFFWHPEMTRFECYVGARLNELLPVVHWYGLDEIFRPRCERHLGQCLQREFCLDCEAAARPFWSLPAQARERQRKDAERFAESAIEHFREEWSACMSEVTSGRRRSVPRPGLDASSDAMGYVRGHWNRLTAWSTGVWIEKFLVDGVDYFSTLDHYAQHLATTAQSLMSGDIVLSQEETRRHRARRVVQDAAYRTFLALEGLDEDAEERLWPALEEASRAAEALRTEGVAEDSAVGALERLYAAFEAMSEARPIPLAIRAGFSASGYAWRGAERMTGLTQQEVVEGATPQLIEGILSALPASSAAIEPERLDAIARVFACSAELQQHGPLASRFAAWSAARPDALGEVTVLAGFEAWASAPPHKDADAEDFAVLPDDAAPLRGSSGRLRLHRTLRRGEFDSAAVAELIGMPEARGAELAAIRHRGELRVIPIDEVGQEILTATEAARPVADWLSDAMWPTLELLLENGFVVWLPTPRSAVSG